MREFRHIFSLDIRLSVKMFLLKVDLQALHTANTDMYRFLRMKSCLIYKSVLIFLNIATVNAQFDISRDEYSNFSQINICSSSGSYNTVSGIKLLDRNILFPQGTNNVNELVKKV